MDEAKPAMTPAATRKISVSGRVQGVGFRAWVEGEATRLGLRGWVRNRRDGDVEILAAGPEDKVEALVAACRHGPAAARVEDVRAAPAGDEAIPEGFAQVTTS